jgi:hypothetical protein
MDHYPDERPQQGIAEGIAMEFYSYVNIFETKGLAYILLLSFLVLGILLIKYLSAPEKKDSQPTDRKPVG